MVMMNFLRAEACQVRAGRFRRLRGLSWFVVAPDSCRTDLFENDAVRLADAMH